MRNVWNVFDSLLKDGGCWGGTGIMCLMTALVASVVFGAGARARRPACSVWPGPRQLFIAVADTTRIRNVQLVFSSARM